MGDGGVRMEFGHAREVADHRHRQGARTDEDRSGQHSNTRETTIALLWGARGGGHDPQVCQSRVSARRTRTKKIRKKCSNDGLQCRGRVRYSPELVAGESARDTVFLVRFAGRVAGGSTFQEHIGVVERRRDSPGVSRAPPLVWRGSPRDELDGRQCDGESRATELRVTVNRHRSSEFCYHLIDNGEPQTRAR